MHAFTAWVCSPRSHRCIPALPLLLSATLMVTPSSAQQQPRHTSSTAESVVATDLWDGTVELYGYLPWLESTTTVRGFESETDLDPGQILQKL